MDKNSMKDTINKIKSALNTALLRFANAGYEHAEEELLITWYSREIQIAEKHPKYIPEHSIDSLKTYIDAHKKHQQELSEEAMDLDVLIKALEDACDAAEAYEKKYLEDKDE